MTASYSVRIKAGAEKELRALPPQDLPRVVARIRALSQNPRPPSHQKLSGTSHYRVRQGDYRIVYAIDETHKSVEIIKVGHRREVYR